MAGFNQKVSTASGVVGLVSGAAMLAPMLVKGVGWIAGKVKGKKAPPAS